MTMSTQPLLKPTDLARRLGVSRSWLYDAAKTGRIPSIRIGGEEGPLRFVSEDIDRWIDQAWAGWCPGRPAVVTRDSANMRRRRPDATAIAGSRDQQRLL
jgi:excisionase family DNA binding protein